MEQSYYRQYYILERQHWWFRVRAGILTDFFTRFISANPGRKILNAGVATGRTSEILDAFGTVLSVESDSGCCRFLREVLTRDVTEASITNMPFPEETFDVVCAFDVIEHIAEDGQAIKELHRVNCRNGWLMLTVPAYPWLWSRHDEINHHYRRYTWSGIRKLLKSNGYTIEYMTGFNSLLFFPIALYRLVANLFRRKKAPLRSDFEAPVLNAWSLPNKILGAVFSFERKLLSFIQFPFGVSILVVARKA